MKKILDHIYFLRPMLMPPVWTIIILGARAAAYGSGANPFLVPKSAQPDTHLALTLLLATLLYGAVYIFNQIHDIESDRENGKLLFLPQGLISIPVAYAMVAVLNLGAVIGAFLISTTLGFLFLVICGMGIIYSLPLTNFKGDPGKGLWANMLGHGMITFLIGWAVTTHAFSLEGAFKSLAYFFAVGAIYLNTTLPDREGDRKTGKRTYAVLWSVDRLQNSALIRVIVAAIFAQLAGDYAMLVGTLAALPFFVMAVITRQVAHSVRATKVAVLALSLMACLYFPLYLPILLLVVFSVRVYYRKRFNLAYPSLK